MTKFRDMKTFRPKTHDDGHLRQQTLRGDFGFNSVSIGGDI